MNRILIAAGAGLIVIAGGLFWYKHSQTEVAPEVVATAPAAAAPAGPPAIEHPLAPETGASTPLPSLQDSDAPLTTDLGTLLGADKVAQYLMPDAVVRRFVATIDNLPRRKIAERLRPLKPVSGSFAVQRSTADNEEVITLAPENYARYDALVKLLTSADSAQVAATYRRYYPLLQKQYEELGFPDQYFNDRLVAVIDHLLQAPEVSEPIKLTQPNVFFEFADPGLEARSSGQKMLIRMGPQNAAAVKAKLKELRAAIASRSLAAKP
jgi:Protein of unknown function (DUF3014)